MGPSLYRGLEVFRVLYRNNIPSVYKLGFRGIRDQQKTEVTHDVRLIDT